MIRPRLIQFCGLVWLVSVLAGCEGATKLYPASGTVTYRGQAVDGATVTFRCEEANAIATGTTDAQGRFELTTYKSGKGAVAGKHKVTVTKMSAPSGAASGSLSMEEAMKQPGPQAQAEPKHLLPQKYADPARPALEFTVSAEGPNDFQIDLTD